MNPFLLTDCYKLLHHKMYPENMVTGYSNFTPRSNRHAPIGANGKPIDKVVSFGQQYFVRWFKELFDEHFFFTIKKPPEISGYSKAEIQAIKTGRLLEIKKEFETYLGGEYDMSHINALMDLGYLPLEFKALPEGTLVPMGVPVLTVKNTHPDFAWLPNYFETLLSNTLWKPMTSAAIALEYRKILEQAAKKTDPDNIAIVDFQAHDFSMRGMSGVESTVLSGMGHCLVFSGTDNIPVLPMLRKYYGAEGFIGGGVPATEHSVMCAGTKEDEIGTFEALLDKFPTDILSVVSDTWDLWKVCTEYLPQLKDKIMSRDGKLVIRPDSGDPVDIICGLDYTGSDKVIDNFYETLEHPNEKGVIQLLWETFGGTINEQGYKVLDSHIGAIYGDSITLDRARQICERLEAKGFASTNIVLGVGSYTYQYNTRDTFGFAMKATYVELKEGLEKECTNYITESCQEVCEDCKCKIIGREIFKDPVTDDGTKKSAKGLLSVLRTTKYINKESTEQSYVLLDQVEPFEEQRGCLKTIFKDGEFLNQTTLEEIKTRLHKELNYE